MTDGTGAVHQKIGGLTKREMFAAMAMQAIASVGETWPRDDDFMEIARRSVMAADALIAELSK